MRRLPPREYLNFIIKLFHRCNGISVGCSPFVFLMAIVQIGAAWSAIDFKIALNMAATVFLRFRQVCGKSFQDSISALEIFHTFESYNTVKEDNS